MVAGRYHEAMESVDQTLQEHPRFANVVRYKAALGLLGRAEEAREWLRRQKRMTMTANDKMMAQISGRGWLHRRA